MEVGEKVKKGLEVCSESGESCKACPYRCGNGNICIPKKSEDALTYIRELEARLAEHERPLRPMTLDEVKRHVKEPEAEPVWLEDVEEPSNTGWTYSHIIYDWMHGFDERTYGKEWRCWPRRPTEEERKAAKWDE